MNWQSILGGSGTTGAVGDSGGGGVGATGSPGIGGSGKGASGAATIFGSNARTEAGQSPLVIVAVVAGILGLALVMFAVLRN